MEPNVSAVLSATAGVLPTLLLTLVLQPVVLSFLARRSADLRARLQELQAKRSGRMLLSVVDAVSPLGVPVVRLVLSAFATTVILVSGVALFTSIGLQVVPTSVWSEQEELAWTAVVGHLGVVALLVLLVIGSFLNLLAAGGAPAGGSGVLPTPAAGTSAPPDGTEASQ